MVRVTEELALSPEHLTLYYANDPLMGHLPVLVFHGPSTTANYTLNSSRIQIHVYSAAGFQAFPRITISPNSPFYGVVGYLPREFQGDEICRGLAFGLFKYFTELPEAVKTHVKNQYPTSRGRRPGSGPTLFGEQHAADLAKSMVQAENAADTIRILESALQTQHISHVDVDLVLPPGSVTPLRPEDLEEVPDDEDDILDPTLRQYGVYTPLVKLFGEPVFLPTSKLRRAPSKPSSLNRSKSFSKDQKVELRLKLGELVDTEERYVLKLNELVRHIADDFRQSARDRPSSSSSPSEDDLERLFPRSADQILQVNSAFMHEMRRVMDESEEEALRDIDAPFPAPRSAGGGVGRPKDPSGTLAMARIFLEWFPKFTDCYQDYIRASQHFPQLLNSFLDQQSSFRQRVAQKGEQAVRSILIEPVQRLPRYSLLIDQIVACLPITHPALQVMLRARDIITNICSMDDPMPDKPHVTNRLRNMVECWPLDLEPRGRLSLGVDVVELAAPYGGDSFDATAAGRERAGILLLFSDCVVIVKKKASSPGGSAVASARDLLREVDKPSPAGLLASMTNAAGGPGSWEYAFTGWHSLADVRFTESSDGQLIWMTSTQEMKGAHSGYATGRGVTSRCFLLQESYQGRAAKWGEDVVRARIEGRFPEAEREDPTWTLRSVRMQDNNLGLHAAVFQEAAEQLVEGRREPAPIRVVVDNDKGTKGAPVGHYGVEVVVEVRSGDLARITMNTLGLNGKRYSDDVALEDFLPSLTRRIIQLLSSQTNVSNSRLAPALVSYYTKILKGCNFASKAEKHRSFLASSPVKLISNFLSSAGAFTATDSQGASKGGGGVGGQRTPLGSSPALLPSQLPRPGSQKESVSPFGSFSEKDRPRITMDDSRPENPLMRLEQTFTGYIASLQARKGHFIGRILLNRAGADELSVNDLYNRLIESPFDLDASADLGTEVIFAAFEKFVRIAWRDQMGPVMTTQALEALQVRASKRVPGDFADFVNYLFGDMAPQNRRAFTALIKLLADLLDGCSNDGDRGALTLAFAELLVDDGSAHDYINLLDRLVEDCDHIFDSGNGGSGFGGASSPLRGSGYESLNSTTRSHKSATGSMTSNTSSLRRKFGFDTLLRQNSSKTTTADQDHRPSMWRSLSKHGRNPATGEAASLSRASINSRSRSIDLGIQQPLLVPHSNNNGGSSNSSNNNNKARRPGSRDRPPVAGAFDDIGHRPASSHPLETIGEPEAEPTSPRTFRKKRRSSLSDLKALMAATTLDDGQAVEESEAAAEGPASAPLIEPLRASKQTSEKFNSAAANRPRTPSPTKIPTNTSSQHGSLRSPRQQQENVLENLERISSAETTATAATTASASSSITTSTIAAAAATPTAPTIMTPTTAQQPHRRGHAKTLSSSNIPTLRPARGGNFGGSGGGGGEAGSRPSSPTRPSTSPSKAAAAAREIPSSSSSPQRLRLHSPQKLRDRLQVEKKVAEEADASLREELSRISEDMARAVNAAGPLALVQGSGPGQEAGQVGAAATATTAELRRLAGSVRALEERVPRMLREMQERQAELRAEMESTARTAEAKVRAVDQLYKEATAENELLYEKFNGELGKMVRALRGKGREDKEELVAKLRESGEERARTKKENARLKREIVSLKTALRSGGSGGERADIV